MPYVEPTESVNPTIDKFRKSINDLPGALPEDTKKILLDYLGTFEELQKPHTHLPLRSHIIVSKEEFEEMKVSIGSMIFIAYGPYRPTRVESIFRRPSDDGLPPTQGDL